MQAKAESRLGRRTWRILVGSTVSAEVLTDLARNAPAGVIVERARPDFPALLGACSVSISQGGYNTVTDVLRAKAKAVIVPFRGAGETEQALRAERLAARGLVTMVEEAELNGRRLAEAVDAASAGKGPSQAELNLDGASRSASLIESWSSERP